MAYVTRNFDGTIRSVLSNPDDGATELLPDDDPEIAAFKARIEAQPPAKEQVDIRATGDPVFKGLIGMLAERFGITEATLLAEIKAHSTGRPPGDPDGSTQQLP